MFGSALSLFVFGFDGVAVGAGGLAVVGGVCSALCPVDDVVGFCGVACASCVLELALPVGAVHDESAGGGGE